MGTPNGHMMHESTIETLDNERQYQVEEKGFTRAKDDDVMPHQWIDLLAEYLNRADSANVEDYRKNLVKVAALAVAAIEAFDRAVH